MNQYTSSPNTSTASAPTPTRPKVLVLVGDGINCELETAEAFRMVGFDVELRHVNDLIEERMGLEALRNQYAVLALPGGFAFGDDLSAGKVLALKIRHGLRWDLAAYAEKGGLVIGICNGFQALIRLGIFGKSISITQNNTGKFINEWVQVVAQSSKCVWLKGIGTMDVPIRHAEGRIVFLPGHDRDVQNELERKGMACLKYKVNPTGSVCDLAGLTDPTGRIFGLMPHPEAFTHWMMHPEWTAQPDRAGAPGEGLRIFKNAYDALVAS